MGNVINMFSVCCVGYFGWGLDLDLVSRDFLILWLMVVVKGGGIVFLI